MSSFSKSGINYYQILDASSVLDKLPPKVYKVQESPTGALFLAEVSSGFTLPDKIFNFNNTKTNSELDQLFLNSRETSSGNLGVLLTGVKGTGKSLLLKKTANKGLERGLPVVMVEDTYDSAKLSGFISSIKQPLIVLFDEFEKKFNPRGGEYDSQEGLLSLFDGTSDTNNLFILTSNSLKNINPFFINRPSRIRYLIDYKALTEEFITSYLNDYLSNNTIVSEVTDTLIESDDINFDMLKTVVAEINSLHPTETVENIFNLLNIDTFKGGEAFYEVTSYIDGKFVGSTTDYVQFDSLSRGMSSSINPPRGISDVQHALLSMLSVTSKNLVQVSKRNHLTVEETITLKDGTTGVVSIVLKRIRGNQLTF